MTITERVKALRERSGLSMAETARRAGWKNASSYQRYENPDEFTGEELTVRVARKLVRAWAGQGHPQITVDDVMALAAAQGVQQSVTTPVIRMVHVVGVVEAGVWREANEIPLDEQKQYPLPPVPGFERVQVYALEVSGHSMNKAYPEGCVVFFVRPEDLTPVDGSHVVATAERGGLFETTLKQLGRDSRGRPALLPLSSDPQHQRAIPLNGQGIQSVKITGVVIAKFERVEQPPRRRR